MKMDIIIVDDERHGVAALKSLIQQYCLNYIGKIYTASNFEDAILIVSNNTVHIAFLDIQLSKGSGFDIAIKLPTTCKIVFVTAFAEHALKAIKYQAFDYLLKPIDPKELLHCIEKCSENDVQPKEQFITIKSKGITIPVLQDSILYLKAKGPYSEIYVNDGNVYTTSQTLKDVQEKLNLRFIRTHKSYLINSNFIEGYNQKNVFLKNKLCFNISRLGLQQLQQYYGS
jgi:two-component system, LytTR family, response regulator